MSENNNKPLAVISGGSGYLGTAIRAALERKGWVVVTLGKTKSEDLISFLCDITNEAETLSTINHIVSVYGNINACIHAATAPVSSKVGIDSMTVESFDSQINVAAKGAFLFAKAALPNMGKDSAFIGITTALIEPGTSLQPMGAYITAKYALRGFLRSLSEEVRLKNIRVYAVAPGFLPGGLNKGIPEAVLKFLGKKSGAGDAKIEDVVSVIEKICTEPSAYPQGSSITIPGKINPL